MQKSWTVSVVNDLENKSYLGVGFFFWPAAKETENDQKKGKIVLKENFKKLTISISEKL